MSKMAIIYDIFSFPFLEVSVKNFTLVVKARTKEASNGNHKDGKSHFTSFHMINSMDFDSVCNEAQKVVWLQELLYGINPNNFEENSSQILSSSFINGSIDDLNELLHTIICSVDIRPRSVTLYATLCTKIISIQPAFQEMLQHLMISIDERKIRRFYFLHQLVHVGAIELKIVIGFIHRLFADRAFKYMKIHRKFALALFCWFAPEVEQEDPNLYHEYENQLKVSHQSPFFNELANLNIPFLQDYQLLSNDNWKLHKISALSGSNHTQIAQSILKDEIVPYDDINGKIRPCLFDFSFLNHMPTLIMYAAYNGSVNTYKYLLENGADISMTDSKKRTLEDFALAGGNNEIISLVLNKDDSNSNNSPLFGSPASSLLGSETDRDPRDLIVTSGHRKVGNKRNIAMNIGAERTFSNATHRRSPKKPQSSLIEGTSPIMSSGPSISPSSSMISTKFSRLGYVNICPSEQVFLRACKSNCIPIVIQCIKEGINPNTRNKDGVPSLSVAAGKGHLEVVRVITYADGIDINAQDKSGETALVSAAKNGHLYVVKYLCSLRDLDVNLGDERETTPLIWASMKGHLNVVEFLCSLKHTDLNAMDEYFGPAYVHAAMHGYLDVVRFLATKEKSGLNMKGDYVSYAIIFAAKNGFLEVIKFLVDREDVNINAKNIYDETALNCAVMSHNLELVKFLSKLPKLKINKKGSDGNSALGTAVIVGDLEIVKYLLTCDGIDIHHRNNGDISIVQLAKMHKQHEIVSFLIENGCIDE